LQLYPIVIYHPSYSNSLFLIVVFLMCHFSGFSLIDFVTQPSFTRRHCDRWSSPGTTRSLSSSKVHHGTVSSIVSCYDYVRFVESFLLMVSVSKMMAASMLYVASKSSALVRCLGIASAFLCGYCIRLAGSLLLMVSVMFRGASITTIIWNIQ
jgi:hypothetical protein